MQSKHMDTYTIPDLRKIIRGSEVSDPLISIKEIEGVLWLTNNYFIAPAELFARLFGVPAAVAPGRWTLPRRTLLAEHGDAPDLARFLSADDYTESLNPVELFSGTQALFDADGGLYALYVRGDGVQVALRKDWVEFFGGDTPLLRQTDRANGPVGVFSDDLHAVIQVRAISWS